MSPRDLGRSFSAGSLCQLAVLSVLVLQWLWPGRSLSGSGGAGLAAAVAMSLPLAALSLALWLQRPSARFWCGVAALFYFCHGLAEAWAVPASRWAGLAEAFLSVTIVLASSWAGLRARLGARPPRNV